MSCFRFIECMKTLLPYETSQHPLIHSRQIAAAAHNTSSSGETKGNRTKAKRIQYHNNELAKTIERDQYGIAARFVTGGYAGTENTRRQMHQIFLVPIANTAGRSLGVGPPSDVGDQSGESRREIYFIRAGAGWCWGDNGGGG